MSGTDDYAGSFTCNCCGRPLTAVDEEVCSVCALVDDALAERP